MGKRKLKNPDGEPPFRIHRKKIGLTYACPVDKDENPIADLEKPLEGLLEFLELKSGLCQYIVACELHESGKKHYHAYCNFDKEVDTTNPRFYDFMDVHPNVLGGGDAGPGFQHYCRKDKVFITNLDKNPFSVALEQNSVAEACDYLWEKRPQVMAINGDRVEKNIAKKMKKAPEKRTDHETYEWEPLKDIKSVILMGTTGIGKSQYALWSKHFKNPLVVSHIDRLKDYNNEIHDGIIFDDMEFNHLPRVAQIHMLDWDIERDIHVRYGCVHIPKHTRKIFTCNYLPFMEHESIARRYKLIELKTKAQIADEAEDQLLTPKNEGRMAKLLKSMPD